MLIIGLSSGAKALCSVCDDEFCVPQKIGAKEFLHRLALAGWDVDKTPDNFGFVSCPSCTRGVLLHRFQQYVDGVH